MPTSRSSLSIIRVKVRYEPYRTSNHQNRHVPRDKWITTYEGPQQDCIHRRHSPDIIVFAICSVTPCLRLLRPPGQGSLLARPVALCRTYRRVCKSNKIADAPFSTYDIPFARKRRPRLGKVDLAAVGYSDALVFWRGQTTTQRAP